MKTNLPQTDYTAMTNGFQLVMPLDCEVKIEKNAPVRLLNAVMERMDYSKLNAAYSRLGRIEYSPKILLKIMVYALIEEHDLLPITSARWERRRTQFIAEINNISSMQEIEESHGFVQ